MHPMVDHSFCGIRTSNHGSTMVSKITSFSDTPWWNMTFLMTSFDGWFDGWNHLSDGIYMNLPSGKHTQNYGKSPCFMGKLTINGHV